MSQPTAQSAVDKKRKKEADADDDSKEKFEDLPEVHLIIKVVDLTLILVETVVSFIIHFSFSLPSSLLS
jgi:hypothetical protein